ncbi:hypothetical protein JAAARDRAFT_166300 [Jaapia argillacea MUCL 33604]|uniref:F-box/LRR-repeat protein 15-like leucin rich repeat domain-containing protein n=1 Tax=Jaapia argillacea MUCL 33604 TaxID=933084 RepID=A0A067QB97_9AGAM|nr:hypothetical protein JAAARDRAFT_166300 [Jaapia argillacea MUCL 33604]
MHIIDRLPTADEQPFVRHLVFQRDDSGEVTDDRLAQILAFCPNLQTVEFHGVPDVSDRTLVQLASTANNLEGIDLTGCRQVTDVGVIELASQCSDLLWMKLSGVVGLTDPSVSIIAKTFPHLIDLDLSDLPLLTALSLRDLWTFSRNLRKLRLARCPQLSDKAFPSPKRRSTSPDPPRDEDEDTEDRHGSWLDMLPGLFLSHTADNLRLLDVSHCVQLTDDAIEGIIDHAPRLQTLVLSGCVTLTDRAVEKMCRLGDNLDTLMLSHVSNITDNAVVKLARSCPKLRCVDLSYCRRLTDLAVTELASLSNLRRMNLIRVRKITDNAIYFIAEHNTTLERLYLSHCDNITLDAIHLLLRRMTTLRHLNATGVAAFKRMGVNRFCDRTPRGHYVVDMHDSFHAFSGANLTALRQFLDKEQRRRWDAEERCIPFAPREDDAMDLY